MVGDGVIAESYISYELTWKNPGKGQQPIWNQNDQVIQLHSTDIYPDLQFTDAHGIATYFTYSSADKLINLLKAIDSVIDSKLSKSSDSEKKANEAYDPPAVVPKFDTPAKIEANKEPDNEPESPDEPKKEDELLKKEEVPAKPDEPGKTQEDLGPYTVKIVGDRLRLIDAQSRGGSINIKYRVSENMIRQVGDETINNESKIKAIVSFGLGRTVELGVKDFQVESGSDLPYAGMNLLVQVLPSIELSFTAGQNTVTPRTQESDYMDSLTKNIKNKDTVAYRNLEKQFRKQEEIIRKQQTEIQALKKKPEPEVNQP